MGVSKRKKGRGIGKEDERWRRGLRGVELGHERRLCPTSFLRRSTVTTTADSQAPGVLLSTLILCASAAPRQLPSGAHCALGGPCLRTTRPLFCFLLRNPVCGGSRHHSIRFCRISNPDIVRGPPTAFFTATSLQLRHPGAVPSLFALPPPEYMKALYPLARTRHLLHPDCVADPEPQLLQHSAAPPVPNDRLCPHNSRPHSWNSP